MSRGRSSSTLALLDAARVAADALADYWPLTLRQVYYRLVAALVIENHKKQYQRLSRVLSDARKAGDFPEEAIEDRSRRLLPADGYSDRAVFVGAELADFLDGYRRDLLQSQPHRLEVWTEKDALSSILYRAALPYCVPVVVVRGQVSTSYLLETRNRFRSAAEREQGLTVLYFGDLDPSGWCIPRAAERTLRDELQAPVTFHRCALNPEQVREYNLPNDPTAQDDKEDKNLPAFLKIYGKMFVELDAVKPEILAEIVEGEIRSRLDLEAYSAEVVAEAHDRRTLAGMRAQVQQFINGMEVQP